MNDSGCRVRKGHFYAVGVGPGSADLLTLRAVSAIQKSQVIICPRSDSSQNSLAFEIIQGIIADQEVVEHVYPMRRSEKDVAESWEQAAELISAHCSRGKTVSQVTLGDPQIYSTCAYILPLLEKRLGADRVHVIPGVTAFQASAANFIQPLTTQDDRLILMSGSDIQAVEKALGNCETLVLYKAGRNLPDIFKLLQKHGLETNARVVFNSEMPGREKVYPDIEMALEHRAGYLACVIIHIGRRKWG